MSDNAIEIIAIETIERHGKYFLSNHVNHPGLTFSLRGVNGHLKIATLWLHDSKEDIQTGEYEVISVAALYDQYYLLVRFRELYKRYTEKGCLRASLLAAEEYEEIIALQDFVTK